MKIDLTQFRQTFLTESAEHIGAMETGLLDLRSTPGDAELLNSIFRSAHSIKGGAASFGMESLVRFTHALESLLDKLRNLELEINDQIVAAMIESVDILRALLDADAQSDMPDGGLALIERLNALAGSPAASHEDEPQAGSLVKTEAGEAEMAFYRIEFRPGREMFSSGTNPVVLLRNLAEMGTVSATGLHADQLPSLSQMDPAQCYLGWTIELATRRPEEELHEVFEFVEHLAEVSILRMGAEGPENQPKSLGVSLAPPPSTPPVLPAVPATEKKSSPVQKAKTHKSAAGDAASIRVSTEKVDRMIDLVGELVIAHVMTAQMVERFTPDCLPKLRESVAAMERSTRELHERVMGIRMLPIGSLFQRYARTVYDMAQATGKEIELVIAGEETEIDKGMLELLSDPLTHMIRNAADHGIEPPAERLAAGKPADGTISLRAFHRSGRIVIEVSDDGRGIDLERVRAKAVQQGLITEDAQLTDDEVRMLVFEPGFSTRDGVTDFSGRGVGMDVVHQNVQQMNGTVSVASQQGNGTTVSIELPLTLAILEGLLVGVAERTLVIPLLSVVETVSPRPGQVQRLAEKGEVVVLREESIPLLRLHRFLGLEIPASVETHDSTNRSLVVIVDAGRKKIGLVVDELLGQQQVVVKSLERHLRKVDGLMGATILGDGCVAPIIDVAGLAALDLYSFRSARKPAAARSTASTAITH